MVVAQDAAESLAARVLTGGAADFLALIYQSVVEGSVIALYVIVGQESDHGGTQRSLPEKDQATEALVLYGCRLVEHLAAEDLAFDGKPSSLVIVDDYSFLPKLLPEYVILSEEELDGVLLVAIDPAGADQEQQVPWLKLRFRVPPDAGRTAEGKPAGVVRRGAAAFHGPPTGSHLSAHLAERLSHPTFSIKIPISALE